ncbi:metallophosphoesterase family protein [Streptomyces montanisoli]|uniref:Nuclease SbcCD subunit D n=1 Tax=Streptomyces montanisoli TaxID=2798581 RepID=A0A940RW68_9ACTN|nr:exonuclease SbcCD subunit D [Streptomyces montanisoli]MBP0458976.1 exonuclease SbcCD subunit D [Streptomyces montanisoli]
MSRLLHTSDWHLGASLYRHSREEDFDAVLAEIAAIARESEPDLIVHSGDLFHSFRPGARDLLRAMRALDELAGIAPTVVIAGNHDSPAYFEFLNLVSGPSWGRGLYFIDRFRPGREGGVLTFDACGGQRMRLAVMPFVHPNQFWQRSTPSATASADYAQGMRELQADLMQTLHDGYDPGRDVLLFAAHVYVAGAKPAKSERGVDTDDAFATAPGDLPVVSYAALGHIHAPQPVNGVPSAVTARYAGSPLQMDFGEHKDIKSVVVVDADPGRPVRALPRPLTSGRRLAYFEGTLDLLRADAHTFEGMFLKAAITDEEDGSLLTRKVAEIVPGAILVDAAPVREATAESVLTGDPAEEPDLPDAFLAYLTQSGLSETTAHSTAATFARLLGEMDDEEPSPVPAQELLRAALDNLWEKAS